MDILKKYLLISVNRTQSKVEDGVGVEGTFKNIHLVNIYDGDMW